MNIDLSTMSAKELRGYKPQIAMALLTDKSQDELKSWAESIGILKQSGKTYCHHITLMFKPDYDYLETLPLGEKLQYEIIGYDSRESISAVVVVPVGHDVKRSDGIDHITIWTDGNTPPKVSNDILEENRWTEVTIDERVILDTEIVYSTNNGTIMTEVARV
jgi:hypothetical protein